MPGHTDASQTKLPALMGQSLKLLGHEPSLYVGWCHLRGKMDQAIPHHFLHTESNQEWENPGNEAWVTLPKATNGLQFNLQILSDAQT